MKKLLKVCNKPLVLVGALIAGVAVVLAKFFMTQECSDKDKSSKDDK